MREGFSGLESVSVFQYVTAGFSILQSDPAKFHACVSDIRIWPGHQSNGNCRRTTGQIDAIHDLMQVS
jgi:hypothetical protein